MASRSVESLEQRAAEQLDVEIIPGTEIMKDVGDVNFARTAGGKGSVYVEHWSWLENYVA